MVVGAAHPQSQSQSQSQTLTQQAPQKPPQTEPSPEDEALERNTDCVYFLASPASCKKGSECEYRHSEQALYNPRDCWFWLNGNCLNLKCSFRHPPLEGLLASPAPSSAGPSLPIPYTAPVPVPVPAGNATFNSSKQAVPCIFFQRGFCSKADKCPFSHGPNSVTTSKVPQAPAATHVTEPSGLKTVFGGLQKCNQEMKIPRGSASKNVVVPPQLKPAPKAVTAPPRNRVSIEPYVPPPSRNFNDKAVKYEARSGFPAMNGDSSGQADLYLQAHVSENHGFQNGKDVDEHLRESSPGFDVLVDDELGDSDYYHGEEQFGRTIVHDGRNLYSMNEYDLDHPANFNPIADGDRERFDSRGYDPCDQMQGRYAWDPKRNSSERLVGGPPHSDRRGYRKSDSPEDNLDLRHCLSKHRRGDGLRSTTSNDYDSLAEERRSRPRRDQQQLPSHEGSLSSRLRGRIKLPGGSPPVNSSDMRLEREDRGRNRDMRLEREDRGRNRDRSRDRSRDRNRDRLSPRGRDRPQSMSHQGRLRDRIQGRVQDDSHDNERRTYKPPHTRREVPEERSSEISRPKRSSEPKPNNASMNSNQQSEGVLSFDGPMPLSEILKRKREAVASGSRKRSSVSKVGNNEKEGVLSNTGPSGTGEVTTTLSSQSHVAKEEIKSAAVDTDGNENEKNDVAPGQSSQEQQDIEDGAIYDGTAEYQELEGEDQREGEYEYEQGEDGEYVYEEGEEVEGEEEYQEEEDGDDFAKKIGVMFS